MLNDAAFEQWCLPLGLSVQAKAIITQIRTSPPARHVQSAAGNRCIIDLLRDRNKATVINYLYRLPNREHVTLICMDMWL
jgi:transposase